jgi:phosphatidylserine/phosphatidylglycerophosphate/cardiolipin synthase-like enzyme
MNMNPETGDWKNEVNIFTSLDGDFAVSDALERTLRIAQNRLLISSPWLGKGFIDLMRKTVPKGVCIQLLTRLPKDNNDNSVEAINALYRLAESCEWKIEVNCTSKFHPKFVVVDNARVLAGSLNPTEAGMYYNHELGFEIKGISLVSRVSDFFHGMWQASVSWQLVKQFNGYERSNRILVKKQIAEDLVELFRSGGNAPLPKWKVVRELKSMGCAESDVIEVYTYLLKQGMLYEPRIDYICLTSADDG